MTDRVPTCYLLTLSSINWDALQRMAATIGRSPFAQLDKSGITSKDHWSFLAALGEIFHPGLSPQIQVGAYDAGRDAIHLTFIGSCYSDDFSELVHRLFDLRYDKVELDKYRCVFTVSGTLSAFRGAIDNRLRSNTSIYTRLFYYSLYELLRKVQLIERLNLTDLPDGSQALP